MNINGQSMNSNHDQAAAMASAADFQRNLQDQSLSNGEQLTELQASLKELLEV